MLLRLMCVWLSSLRRRPFRPLEPGHIRLSCYPNDLDLNLHMNNGRFFSAADLGRFDWWFRTGLWHKAWKRGWRPLAGDANARFSRSIEVFQRYDLVTRLVGWDDKWLFKEHRFERRGTVIATVFIRYLWAGPDGKIPSAQLLALIGVDTPSPPLPEWLREWSAAQDKFSASLRTTKTH